jgi:hypothetical protein
MSYDDELAALCRTVTWKVVLRLDYCAHTCGQDPCAAAGPPWCYYTYPTCLDPAHFSRGTKDYAFALADGPRLEGCLPCLAEIKSVPTEIRPEDNVTRRARITLEFFDDAPLALANPDRTVSNAESGGSFFRNLFARNPNLQDRTAEIWQGFLGLPLNEYRLHFRGAIDDLEWREGRARVVVKDLLKLLEREIPPEQSSGNELTSAYNGDETMAVADASQFEAPGTVKVEDEYVTFTGIADETLYGCVAGAFGSSATSHAKGVRVRQVEIFAEPEGGAGLPPDELFLDLLCRLGGIDPLAIATVDRGTELAEGIADDVLDLPLNASAGLPETGVARIGDELIRYRGIADSGLLAVERGAYGTEAAAHDAGAAVLVTTFSDELGRWMAGTLFRRSVEEAAAVKDLVNRLRAQCLLHVWQGEDSTIRAKCVAPPFYTDAPLELDDATGFIAGSTSWDPGNALRATRIVVHYAPMTADAGERSEDYAGLLVVVDAEAESAAFFGKASPKEIFADWIYREREALLLASRMLIRYRSGAAGFRFATELKEDGLAVGDFVRVTSADVTDAAGAPRSRALFEVTKKQRVSDNRIEFTAIDTRLDRRYPLIGPAELSVDYDEAEGDDCERYGFVGNEGNGVGAAGGDGYYIY